MVYAMIHAQNIPPEIQLDIWQWLKHNIGMEASIVLLILLVAFLFLAAAAIKGLCTRKGDTTNVKMDVDKMHVGDNYNFNTAPTYKVWRGSRLSERDWEIYQGDRYEYELLAGHYAAEPVFATTDGYPQAILMKLGRTTCKRDEIAYLPEEIEAYALIWLETPMSTPRLKQLSADPTEHTRNAAKLYALITKATSQPDVLDVKL